MADNQLAFNPADHNGELNLPVLVNEEPFRYRVITLEEQIAPHFAEIRRLVRQVSEHERAIYNIVRNAATPALNRTGNRHSVLVNMFEVMDNQWYTVDYSLKAAEFHAKAMCVMCRARDES